jgi:hypothetical protein
MKKSKEKTGAQLIAKDRLIIAGDFYCCGYRPSSTHQKQQQIIVYACQ